MPLKNPPRYTGEVEGEYDARAYFEKKLRIWPDLRGTGHRKFSLIYNEAMYQVATTRLNAVLHRHRIEFQGKKVLDIGPGVGYFVQKFIEWGAEEVVGLDITEASVQILHEKFPGHRFMKGDISLPDINLDVDFDLVFAISVIFHITRDDRFKTALENMCRSVKPGGYLIIVDSFSKPLLPSGKHVRLRPLNAYLPILEENGFEIIQKTPMYYVMGNSFFPFLVPQILSWPPILKRLVKLDYWLENHFRSNLKALKYLVTQRKLVESSAPRISPQ